MINNWEQLELDIINKRLYKQLRPIYNELKVKGFKTMSKRKMEESATEVISIKVTPSQKREIEEAAKMDKRSLSSYVKILLGLL
ncbi:hypothetical protein NUACC26_085530 [Scytonema sp. NUACC26]